MDFVVIALVAAVTFGICFLADKGFQKTFRNRPQHRSGKAVRQNKRYGSFGLILAVLGLAAILAGIGQKPLFFFAGGLLILMGAGLIVYYLTYGIYYDGESFLYTSFGRKGRTYRYGQIQSQQLYRLQGGSILVELHLEQNRSVQIPLNLTNAEDFLNTAFLGWVQQNNIDIRTTDFHHPENSCWFPGKEAE